MDSTTRKRLDDIYRLMNAAGSVGEAEAAAAAMQRLILKHNLSAADLEGLGETKKEEYLADFIRVAPDGKPGIQWRLNLLNVLCEYNFCAFIRHGVHGATGVIVGQQSNKDAVRQMFQVTVETIERIAESEWYQVRNNVHQWGLAGCPTAMGWKNSFKIGFPAGLKLKMQLELESELLGDDRASALVITKDGELTEAIQEKVGKTRQYKGSAPTNADGYNRGVEKGRAHELQERLS